MGCRVLPALLSLLRARAGAGAVPGVVVAAAVGPGQRVMAQLGALGCSEQEQAEEGAELFLLGHVTSSAQTLRSRQHHSPAHFDRVICTLGTGCSCLSRKCPFWYWQGPDPDSPDTPTWQRPPSFLLSLFSFLPFAVSLAPSTPPLSHAHLWRSWMPAVRSPVPPSSAGPWAAAFCLPKFSRCLCTHNTTAADFNEVVFNILPEKLEGG